MPPQLASLPLDRLAQLQNPMVLLNPEAAALIRDGLAQIGPQGVQLYDSLHGAITVALASSLHDAFVASEVVAVAGVANALFTQEVPLRRGKPAQAAAAVAPVKDKIEVAA